MKEEALKAAVARIEAIKWFCRAGTFMANETEERIRTWDEARIACSEAENARLFFSNEQGFALQRVSYELYNTWNTTIRAAKAAFAPRIYPSVDAAVRANGLPASVFAAVRWDLLGAMIDVAYADQIAPGVFTRKLELYEQGFFPCGWEGEPPQGRLLVL